MNPIRHFFQSILCLIGLHSYHFPMKNAQVPVFSVFNEVVAHFIRIHRMECRCCKKQSPSSIKFEKRLKAHLR